MSAALESLPLPEISLRAHIRRTAIELYWKHVANRTCLSILADNRTPLGKAKLTFVHSTRGRDQAGSKKAGSDVFFVKAEPVQILYGERTVITAPLHLEVRVLPKGEASIQTLATLRTWPTPRSTDVLYRYRRDLQAFERKAGLSGDMVYLFEELLRPHRAELLAALQLHP